MRKNTLNSSLGALQRDNSKLSYQSSFLPGGMFPGKNLYMNDNISEVSDDDSQDDSLDRGH